MPQLIVNGDDFGRSPGVNQGILDAHRSGIVTSTTVMVNFPDAEPGLARALDEAPDLGLGLHLNLTAGAPVSDPARVASLVGPDGLFYPIQTWPAHYAAFEADHLQREIAAQVERFIRLAGRPPDHLDAHHHAAYLHPVALRAVLEIAAGYAIPIRSSGLENDAEQVQRVFHEWLPDMAQAFGPSLIEQLQAVLAEGPAPYWPARLEMGFSGARATLGELLVILTNLPEGSLTELLCHPRYPDELRGPSVYDREVEFLTHPATLECIKAERIELISFGDLPRRQPGRDAP